MIRRFIAAVVTAACASTLFVGIGAIPAAEAAAGKPRVFANCTQLNKVYPHGVGRSGARDKGTSKSFRPVTNFKRNTAVYNANKKSDRDKDGIACEKR